MSIFEKIKKLSDQFEKDGQEIPGEIKDWSREAKEAQVYAHLLKFDGMDLFFKKLTKEILDINDKLSSNRNLSDSERQYLYGMKDEKLAVINFFNTKDKILNDLEEKVNAELEN